MKFYCDNMKIRDEHDRQRIFKGINLCMKDPKISPRRLKKFLYTAGSTSLEACKKCGVNIIRLGITWALIEPKRGIYNNEALTVIKEFVNDCEDMGIYVVIDMHQDLFSKKFHGDGAPDWAIDDNIKGQKYLAIWAEGYFYMDSVQQAFSDFWNNKNGCLDDFARCWDYLRNYFKDCSNVIGFDYLNEPYVDKNGRKIFLEIVKRMYALSFGKDFDFEKYFIASKDRNGFIKSVLKIASAVKSPSGVKKLLSDIDDYGNFKNVIDGLEKYTDEFNKGNYQKFTDMMSGKNKTDKFNLFEHNYYANLGVNFDIDMPKNSIYSPHAYDLFIDSPLYDNYSSNDRVQYILDKIRDNQLKMNVPVIFGEWGGTGFTGEKWTEHIDYIYRQFEKNQWSSIYWHLDNNKKRLIEVFNRPYPCAVCGDITEYSTDVNSRTFTMRWVQADDCKDVKNIVFIPQLGFTEIDGKKGENSITMKY
ncbi:MAG: cellulase family glycosylhydrolase [Eubacterium sp.]